MYGTVADLLGGKYEYRLGIVAKGRAMKGCIVGVRQFFAKNQTTTPEDGLGHPQLATTIPMAAGNAQRKCSAGVRRSREGCVQ